MKHVNTWAGVGLRQVQLNTSYPRYSSNDLHGAAHIQCSGGCWRMCIAGPGKKTFQETYLLDSTSMTPSHIDVLQELNRVFIDRICHVQNLEAIALQALSPHIRAVEKRDTTRPIWITFWSLDISGDSSILF